MGSASCLSFYANKLVTTGEGGMVLTDDGELALRLASVRNLGFGESRRFVHECLGHNFRLSNIQAALGMRQVARLGALVDRKRELGRRYDAGLRDCAELQLPIERPWARSVYWMYGLVMRDGGPDAATLAERLRELGVDTRPFFRGMHEQPVLNELGLFAGESHPVAERLARRGLYLPSGLGLTDSEQDRVIEAVRKALGHA
jgi:perosamine synthetase